MCTILAASCRHYSTQSEPPTTLSYQINVKTNEKETKKNNTCYHLHTHTHTHTHTRRQRAKQVVPWLQHDLSCQPFIFTSIYPRGNKIRELEKVPQNAQYYIAHILGI